MGGVVERVISYTIGGVGGALLGVLLLSLDVPALFPETSTVVFTFLLGLLIAVLVYEYRKDIMLQGNNKIRNETVALITHEMRTSLTATGWSLEYILGKYGPAFDEKDRKATQSTIDSISTTVMHSVNLLDISLLDIKKLSIVLTWMPLSMVERMIRETIARFDLGATKDGITITVDVRLDTKKEVEVDMLRLRVVVENLLENAIRYSLRDEKKILITIHNDEQELHISVQDTGIGIPVAEQKEIFKEFYRASNARSGMASGSGIGLYLCKEYVEAHHGTIRFESVENTGTTFFVSIPMKTDARVNEFFEAV